MELTVPARSTSPHNLTQVGVYVDREQVPRKPLFLNFDEAGCQNVITGYQSLFSGTGKLSEDNNQTSRSDYGSGYAAFCFDLSPDPCSGDHFQRIKQDNLILASFQGTTGQYG